MSLKVSFLFSGSRILTSMIEKMCIAVPNLQIVMFESSECKMAEDAAHHTKTELRVLMPQIVAEVTEDEAQLSEADFIIFPGLHIDFKNDEDFTKIVTKLVRKFMTAPLKQSAKILINGSFRGLLIAKIVADHLPSTKENIHVLDPISFSGGRILGYSKTDGILYSTQNQKLLVHGTNVSTDQKDMVQAVISESKKKRFESVENLMLSTGLQFLSEDQEEGLEFSGRFPTQDEETFYEIDGSLPVFLPANRETDPRITDSVKQVYTEMKEMFPSQE